MVSLWRVFTIAAGLLVMLSLLPWVHNLVWGRRNADFVVPVALRLIALGGVVSLVARRRPGVS